MIERQAIGGRPVTIAYLDRGFSPTDKDTAQLVKLSFDDGETSFLSTSQPGEQEGEAESDAWNAHRARHREPLVAPGTPDALERPSRREAIRTTPHNFAVRNFALAMREAEKHRGTLKQRFGYDDKQIATLATAALAKHGKRPYHDLAAAYAKARARRT